MTLTRAGTLATRDTALRELMDDPHCDPERLAATYRRFAIVNRLIAGWDAVYRRTMRPYLRSLGRPARVLDLGTGGGDVVDRLARLASHDGITIAWTGADPDPRARRASAARASAGIRFVSATSAQLRDAGETFDVVLSNHVLHHLSPAELRAFAGDSRALSSGIVLHSDIERGRIAYGLYAIGITPLAPGTFLRTDGLRSIRRSYRAEELAHALGEGWRVHRPVPFRLLATAAGRA